MMSYGFMLCFLQILNIEGKDDVVNNRSSWHSLHPQLYFTADDGCVMDVSVKWAKNISVNEDQI